MSLRDVVFGSLLGPLMGGLPVSPVDFKKW